MSFSAEMKDFLTAYKTGTDINAKRTTQDYQEAQTDSTTKKTARDNDPETLELEGKQAQANLDATNARIRATNAAVGHTGVQNEYTRALIAQMKAANGGGGTGLLPPGMGAVPTGAPSSTGGSLPLQSTIDPNASLYADGGIVPDDESTDDSTTNTTPDPTDPSTTPDVVSNGALNTGVAPNPDAAGDTDFSSQGRRRIPAMPNNVHDAVLGAYKYGTSAFGLPGTGAIHTPKQIARARALAAGAGALSDQEMQAARQAVDPNGKLSDGQRNMAALGAVYQYWANKNEPEKAQKVAFQMLQHYRLASQRYAAIAAHAAEQGNTDLATKAALKAYANVPDGRDIMIEKSDDGRLKYSYTDENGKTISQGVATPQQLAASAMGLAQNGFDKAIMNAAGQREEDAGGAGAVNPQGTAKPPKGPQPLSTDTAGEIDNAVTAHQKKWTDATKKAGGDVALNDDYWNTVKNTATHLRQNDPTMTADEAVTASKTLLYPDPKQPAPFKVTSENDGVNTIKLKNGLALKVSDDQLDSIVDYRSSLLKQQQDKEDADKSGKGKPTFMDRLGAVGGAVAAGLNDPTKTPVFPGGTSAPQPGDNSEPAPPVARQPPYVPFMANRGAIPLDQ
jgi:hypothetical protein